MYNDDVEIVNPLGNKTAIHKISAFYYCINNIERIGSLKNIYWWGLCYANDVNKYGFQKILRPFVDELKTLEKGVKVVIHNQSVTLKFILAGVTGDTLAMHLLFEIKSSASNYFCRQCWLLKPEFKKYPWKTGEHRTKQNYEELLKEPKETQHEKGIVGIPILHELNFHLTENYIFDIMHDCFEGCSGLLIKLVLRFMFQNKLFTESEINERINNFNYGYAMRLDKPSPNITKKKMLKETDSKLQQRAMQTWLFVRVLPFLISDKLKNVVDVDKIRTVERIKELISMHLEILCIVMSFVITKQDINNLYILTTEHNKLLFNIFPDAQKMHKLHHLLHMPDCIQKTGPIRYWWTARFESAHLEIKKKVHASANFRNVPKMLVEQHAFTFGFEHTYPSKKTTYIIHSEVPQNTSFFLNPPSIVCSRLTFDNIEYAIKMILLVAFTDNYPVFGEIISMGITNEQLLFKLKIYKTLHFYYEFSGFGIDDSMISTQEIWHNELPEKQTFYVWSPIGSDTKIIPLRENLSSEIKQ